MQLNNSNEDFDIEAYRSGSESDEHWQLKKRFIEAHKQNYPEEELACLVQLFYNIQILGCKYAPAVMKKIKYLSRGIVDDYKRSRQNTIERTFISGNDAAKNKAQGK